MGGSNLRLSGAAELHRTQPHDASFPCFFFPFSSFLFSLFLFSPSFSFSFPFPFLLFLFLSFPSFLTSFLFLLSPWGWVRRCLAASLSLLSVSCFCFLCFQLSLSLWPLFSASASGSSIYSPLFIFSSISSVHGSVLTLAAMAFSCRHWVRVMVRLSIW